MIPPMLKKKGAAGEPRAVLAGILIACWLIDPAIGALTGLGRELAALKGEAAERLRRGIDESDLVVLEFTLEEAGTLLQGENSREFEYGGRMYDIVATRARGDTVRITCWPDEEETRLNDRIRELASREWGEVCSLERDEDRAGSAQMTSLGAVVCDGRVSEARARRFQRLLRLSFPSASHRPPTPPPRPA
jgi:hypothetical protein